jgi:molybdate transport system regulatory protein
LPGAVNTEVSIELAQGIVIAAMISSASAAELSLHEGQSACAIFKASSVILGTVD